MPMTMYEIAFPVTINIGAWAVVYVRGRLSNELHRKQDTLFPQLLDSRKITELLSWAVVYESHRPCYLFIGQPGKIPPSGKELPQ